MSYKIVVINLGVRHRNKIQLHQETKFFSHEMRDLKMYDNISEIAPRVDNFEES